MKREFKFTRNDFNLIRAILKQNAGISLSEHKFEMVYSRLARRLRETRHKTVSDYLGFIEENYDEYIQFINALTTNLTYFFRETHHFEFIENHVLKELEHKHLNDKRVRFWSAGCSTGEEAYSLAAVTHPFKQAHESWDIKILATDLDSNVLVKAKEAHFDSDKVAKIDQKWKARLFTKGRKSTCIKPELKNMVYFKRLNLMDTWPMSGQFDLIMCRNVLIYFDKPTQLRLIERFKDYLYEGGYLMLGHSESMAQQVREFKPVGRTIYQKVI
jgi:chemotaxis protein methyltransferase CheR